MNEYIALTNTDNMFKFKTYLGYGKNCCVVLTHIKSGSKAIQLHNPIYTIDANVSLVNTKVQIPFPVPELMI